MKHRSSSHLGESVATIPKVSDVMETEVVKVRERRLGRMQRNMIQMDFGSAWLKEMPESHRAVILWSHLSSMVC